MLILGHHQQKTLKADLISCIQLNQLYAQNVYGLEKELLERLEIVEKSFENMGKSTLESKVVRLKTYLTTAIQGMDPKSLEKIKTNKRTVVKGACFYCLTELSIILEEELNKINHLLLESQNTLNQIILSLIQSNLMTQDKLKEMKSIEKIEAFWAEIIAQNENIHTIDLQLRQKILKEDIYLLLADSIDNL